MPWRMEQGLQEAVLVRGAEPALGQGQAGRQEGTRAVNLSGAVLSAATSADTFGLSHLPGGRCQHVMGRGFSIVGFLTFKRHWEG